MVALTLLGYGEVLALGARHAAVTDVRVRAVKVAVVANG